MSLFDTIVLLIVAFVIILAAMFTYFIVDEVKSAPSVIEVFNSTGTSTSHFDKAETGLKTFDYGVALFIFVTGLVTIALATMINSNPVFFFASFLVLIITVMVSAILSNIFIDIVSSDMLVGITAEFPITMAIIGIYPTICLVISAIVAIVQYTKTSSYNSGYGP